MWRFGTDPRSLPGDSSPLMMVWEAVLLGRRLDGDCGAGSVWTAGPVALEMVRVGPVLPCLGDRRQGLTTVVW